MTPEEFTAMIKLVMHHDKLIGLLAQTAGDHACLLMPHFVKCSKENCDHPATMKHKFLELTMCDYHTAVSIVNAGRNFNTNKEDNLNDVRATIMREEDWEEMQDVELIRRTTEYVELIRNSSGKTSMH